MVWFVCGWQVKLCDSLVTHGPCLSCTITVLRGSFVLTVIVAVCLQFNKRYYYFLWYYYTLLLLLLQTSVTYIGIQKLN